MTEDTKRDQAAGENSAISTDKKKDIDTVKKQRRGLISRIWNGLFGIRGDDFEKRLQHISKEEAYVLAKMKKRSQTWRKTARHILIFSVIFEAVAVGYAIMTTRSLDLNWKMRALRVLPMFLLPVLSSVIYSTLVSFTRMRDRKDQKTLERLRAERRAKIDELKERTNYYSTQQLIQRYDSDPAAKAAAATVLASKLGADSGLKVYLGDESKSNAPSGKSKDTDFVQSSGPRNRKQSHARSSSVESVMMHQPIEEIPRDTGLEGSTNPAQDRTVVVEHHPTSIMLDQGWIARIAALLVGEDPTESYALICGNCHMHNGLARKEDFPYITYYCPHCHALNRPRQPEEHPSGSIPTDPSYTTTRVSGNGNDSASSVTENKLESSNSEAVIEN